MAAETNAVARWLKKHGGPPAKRRLCELVLARTGKSLRWATIHDIARGRVQCSLDTARLLDAATDGAIPALEMLGLRPARRARSKRVAARAAA
jgi:hypothetical protein